MTDRKNISNIQSELRKKWNISTAFFQRRIFYNGVALYDCLPLSLKLETNRMTFNKQLKIFVFDLCGYSVYKFQTGHK